MPHTETLRPSGRATAPDMTLRCMYGGRKECSITIHRGGKIAKSQQATPGVSVAHVITVRMDGS